MQKTICAGSDNWFTKGNNFLPHSQHTAHATAELCFAPLSGCCGPAAPGSLPWCWQQPLLSSHLKTAEALPQNSILRACAHFSRGIVRLSCLQTVPMLPTHFLCCNTGCSWVAQGLRAAPQWVWQASGVHGFWEQYAVFLFFCGISASAWSKTVTLSYTWNRLGPFRQCCTPLFMSSLLRFAHLTRRECCVEWHSQYWVLCF